MCDHKKSDDNILYVIRKNKTYIPEEFTIESPNQKPCCKVDEFARNEDQEFNEKFLKTVESLTVLIVRILIVLGIKKCRACKGFESIRQAILYFDGVPNKHTCDIKKRIRKATLFNNLGRDAKMTAKEASLTYMVLKNIFKVFYNTVGEKGETGFHNFSAWKHTSTKITMIYNRENVNIPELNIKILCLVKKYLFAMMKTTCCESLEVPKRCFNLDCPSCYKNLTSKFYGWPTLEGFSLNDKEQVFFRPSRMDEEILRNNAPDGSR